MANTLTSISQSMLQDTVLPALKLGLSPLNAMSFMPTSDVKAVGDSVIVPVVSTKTAGTYSSTFESGDSTVTGTSVTLAAPTFSSWFVNPNLEGIPTAERFLACGREAAYAVAKSIVQDVLGKFVAANIGDTTADKITVTAANYDVDDQADMKGLLATKGVNGPLSAIHNVSYATNSWKDAAIQDASAYGNGTLIQTGEMPPVLGIRQYYTDAFPTAVTSENTGVIMTSPQTVAIATAVPAVVQSGDAERAGERNMVVTDPGSGLSMVWSTWYNTATKAYWGSVYLIHGQSFVQDAAVRCVSA